MAAHAARVDGDAKGQRLAAGEAGARTQAKHTGSAERDPEPRPLTPSTTAAPRAESLPAPAAGTGQAPQLPLEAQARVREATAPAPLAAAPGEAVVSGAISAGSAHLHVSTEALGDVALHLRVQDGAARVRVEASDHQRVEAHAPELARALAAEGLSLSRLEVEPRHGTTAGQEARAGTDPGGSAPRGGTSGAPAQGHGRSDGDGREAPAPRPSTPPPGARRARIHDGQHDVTA